MTPPLPAGCTIEVRPFEAPPRSGDIVVFPLCGQLLAHRLVRRQGEYWIAQGDARRLPDPSIPEPFLIGRVVEARLGQRSVWAHRHSFFTRQRWALRHHLLRLTRLPHRLGRRITRLWTMPSF
jgi:hypothetical protein